MMMTVQTRVAMMFKCESGADDVSSHDGDSDRDPSYYFFPDFYLLVISCSKDSLDQQQGAIDTTQIGPIDMEISSTIDDLGSIECNVPVLQPELVEENSPSVRLLPSGYENEKAVNLKEELSLVNETKFKHSGIVLLLYGCRLSNAIGRGKVNLCWLCVGDTMEMPGRQGRTQDFLPGGAHRKWGTNNYI